MQYYRYSELIIGRGSAPAPPEFIALRSSGWAKKKGQGCALPIRLLAHLGAQVALQQGLILRLSRRNYSKVVPQMGRQYIPDQAR